MTVARRTAFVTGASQGIGAATAAVLAANGYDVAVSSTETFGNLILGPGSSTITSSNGTAAGDSTALSFGTLTRQPGATVDFAAAPRPSCRNARMDTVGVVMDESRSGNRDRDSAPPGWLVGAIFLALSGNLHAD